MLSGFAASGAKNLGGRVSATGAIFAAGTARWALVEWPAWPQGVLPWWQHECASESPDVWARQRLPQIPLANRSSAKSMEAACFMACVISFDGTIFLPAT